MSHQRPALIVALVALTATSVACRNPNTEEARQEFRTAILEDRVDSVRKWLDAGMSPNEEATEDCATPLAVAALRGNEAIVELLASYGAELNAAAGPSGRTALGCVAAAEDNSDMVSALLQLGAEANQPEQDGRTPLMHAATGGFVQTVRVLLEARADVHARTTAGTTAVDLAAAANQTEVVALLVRAGARLAQAAKPADEVPAGPSLMSIVTPLGNITLGQLWDDLRPLLDTGSLIDTAHPSPTRAVETRRINGTMYKLTFDRDGKTGPYRLQRIDVE